MKKQVSYPNTAPATSGMKSSNAMKHQSIKSGAKTLNRGTPTRDANTPGASNTVMVGGKPVDLKS